MEVYDEIDEVEYQRLRPLCGNAIPTMCVLTIKYKDGHADRAKCRIVVLGNLDPKQYSKSDKYAPVLSHLHLRLLLALAISHKCVLRQGDVKNAFRNGILPPDEVIVVCPPKGCPLSQPGTYWRLKRTLYGLVRSPLHWYNTMKKFLNQIGMFSSDYAPCLFTGTLLPNKPPIFLGLYVNDFAFFSASDAVEEKFIDLMNSRFTVSWEDQLDWFLGMKFTWKQTSEEAACHVSQEAFILELLAKHNLANCCAGPRETPFRSGLPIDNIAPSDLHPSKQKTLMQTYQELCGSINWLSVSTRPDITAVHKMLSEHQQRPSKGHMDAALYVLRYLASTPTSGLVFTSAATNLINLFVKFPIDDLVTALCDSNWGPQDASRPDPDNPFQYSSLNALRSLSSYLALMSGGPLAWDTIRQKTTVLSSCQAEVHSINEAVKLILELKLLLRALNILSE